MKYAITIFVLLFLCKARLIISADTDTTETNSQDYRDYNPELVQDFADVVTVVLENWMEISGANV